MGHFKKPLKITGIAFLVALIVVIAVATWIHFSEISGREKMERSEMLGTGLALLTCIVVAPFWFAAAGRVNRERQAEREAENQK